MKVLLRNPRRVVELTGPRTVAALLQRLELNPESVLVIVGDDLVTHDARLDDEATIEIRPVTSGGDGTQPWSDDRDGGVESTRQSGAW
jgi:sulfur carrier protein